MKTHKIAAICTSLILITIQVAVLMVDGQATLCESEPCQNGALCEEFTNNTYQCFCVNGYAGENCEIDFDDCSSDPCLNDGSCIDAVADFSCVCAGGFTGKTCQENIDDCLGSECLNNGTCIDMVNGYVCQCAPPYTGSNCSLLPCDALQCANGGTCQNDVNFSSSDVGYVCNCTTGFSGALCQINIQDCDVTSCSGNGLCVDGIGEYRCLCGPGWVGQFCQLPVDDCIGNSCRNNATCMDLHLGYECTCSEGYEGALCERERNECNAWQPCQNAAKCVDMFNDYSCECLDGWMGRNCSDEINECQKNLCQNDAQCVDIVNDFTCLCRPFYTGVYCETLYNPCAAEYNPCRNGANCITPPDGQYRCFCQKGFTGINCEVNINECLTDPCLNNGTCEDTISSYICHCTIGWEGQNCHENVDDCARMPCLNDATCIDKLNGFECNCTREFEGEICQDTVDFCESTPCHNNATCLSIDANFWCFCTFPYTGQRCENLIDSCQNGPCEHNGTCYNVGVPQGFQCNCPLPYTGTNCSDRVDFCASDPCFNAATCVSLKYDYICVCPEFLTGRQCTELNDFCEDIPCENEGICINGQYQFKCICLYGYTGVTCSEMVDFCSDVPCQNAGNCTNIPGGFVCECLSNYTGELCQNFIPPLVSTSSIQLPSTSSVILTSLSLRPTMTFTSETIYPTTIPPTSFSSTEMSTLPTLFTSTETTIPPTSFTSTDAVSLSSYSIISVISDSISLGISSTLNFETRTTVPATLPSMTMSSVHEISESVADSDMFLSSSVHDASTETVLSSPLFTLPTEVLSSATSSSSVFIESTLSVFSSEMSSTVSSRLQVTATEESTFETVYGTPSLILTSETVYGTPTSILFSETVYGTPTSILFSETVYGTPTSILFSETVYGTPTSLLSSETVYGTPTSILSFETVHGTPTSILSSASLISALDSGIISSTASSTSTMSPYVSDHSSSVLVTGSFSSTSAFELPQTTMHISTENLYSSSEITTPSSSPTSSQITTSTTSSMSSLDTESVSSTSVTLVYPSSVLAVTSSLDTAMSTSSQKISASISSVLSSDYLLTSSDFLLTSSDYLLTTSDFLLTSSEINLNSTSISTSTLSVASTSSNQISSTSDLKSAASPSSMVTAIPSSSVPTPKESADSSSLTFSPETSVILSTFSSQAVETESKIQPSSSSGMASFISNSESVSTTTVQSSDYRTDVSTNLLSSDSNLQSRTVTQTSLSTYESTLLLQSSTIVTASQLYNESTPTITDSTPVFTSSSMSSLSSESSLLVSSMTSAMSTTISAQPDPSTINPSTLQPTVTSFMVSDDPNLSSRYSDEFSTTDTATISESGSIQLFTSVSLPLSSDSDSSSTISVRLSDFSTSLFSSFDSLSFSLFSTSFDLTSDRSTISVFVASSTVSQTFVIQPTTSGLTLHSTLHTADFSTEAEQSDFDTISTTSYAESSSFPRTSTSLIDTKISSLVSTRSSASLETTTSSMIPSVHSSDVSSSEQTTLHSSVQTVYSSNFLTSTQVQTGLVSTSTSTQTLSVTVVPTTSSMLLPDDSSFDGSFSTDLTLSTSTARQSELSSYESSPLETASVKPSEASTIRLTSSLQSSAPSFSTFADTSFTETLPISTTTLFTTTSLVATITKTVVSSSIQSSDMSSSAISSTFSEIYSEISPTPSGETNSVFPSSLTDSPTLDVSSIESTVPFMSSSEFESSLRSSLSNSVHISPSTTQRVQNPTTSLVMSSDGSSIPLSVTNLPTSSLLVSSNSEATSINPFLSTSSDTFSLIPTDSLLVTQTPTEKLSSITTTEISPPSTTARDRFSSSAINIDSTLSSTSPSSSIPTSSSAITSTTTTTTSSSTTAPPDASCQSMECVNGGVCRTDALGVFCDCRPGFIGEHCEIESTICADYICENDGKCSVTIGQFLVQVPRCDCPIPFSGPRCEIEKLMYFPAFTSTSFVRLAPPTISSDQSNEIYISVKTNQLDGTIFYSSNQKAASIFPVENSEAAFVRLRVIGGMLRYEFSCDGAIRGEIQTDTYISTGDLHDIVIRQVWASGAGQWCNAAMTVNDRAYISTPSLTMGSSKTLNDFYLGGYPRYTYTTSDTGSSHTHVLDGLVGCVRSLQINQREIDILGDAVESRNIDNCNVPVCQHSPCTNGATCHSSGEEWYCSCALGFGGVFCEHVLCQVNTCQHGGTCVILEDVNDQLCVCPYGSAGALCEEEISVEMPHFHGNQYGYSSYISYEHPHFMEENFQIEMTVIIDEGVDDGSLLLFMGNTGSASGRQDFFAVGIEFNYAVFRFDLGSGFAQIYSAQPLDLNLHRHVFRLGRHVRQGWLQVDAQRNMTGFSMGKLTALNTNTRLYVGGVDLAAVGKVLEGAEFTNGFKGCVVELRMKTHQTEFQSPGYPPGHVTEGRNVIGCSSMSCDHDPCQNAAACVDIGASVFCSCTEQWKGTFCLDTITICDTGNTCTQGSTCVPTLAGDFKCLCPLGRQGELCDTDIAISDALLNGEDSYMALEPVFVKKYTHIRLQFKITQTSGLVFYVAQHQHKIAKDFLAVSLNNGLVELRFDLGSGVTVVQNDQKVEKGMWTVVEAGRNQTHAYIAVNGYYAVALVTGMMSYLDVTSHFYLGGMADMSDVSSLALSSDPVAFGGCIRQLVVNGHEYILSENGAIEGRNIGDCDRTECGYNVCKNNGTCSVLNNTCSVVNRNCSGENASCTEVNGTCSGENASCTEVNVTCSVENTTCFVENSTCSEAVNMFQCQCSDDFYGETCEFPVQCRDQVCVHGKCMVDEVTGYTCDCFIGWTGNNCEIELLLGSVVRFSKNSFVLLSDHYHSNKTHTDMTFTFRTADTDGLVFWNGQTYSDDEDYLGVGMESGRVKLVWNLGWFTKGQLETSLKYNDDRWHFVNITRVDQRLLLSVDDIEYENRVSGDFHDLDTIGHIFLGGFDKDDSVRTSTFGYFSSGYSGCLGNVTINKSPPVIFDNVDNGLNIDTCD